LDADPGTITAPLTELAGSVTDEAVMVTFAPLLGGVYVVAVPLGVVVGLNDPQDPAGVQLQLTPAFAASLVTAATGLAVDPCATTLGGAVVKLI